MSSQAAQSLFSLLDNEDFSIFTWGSVTVERYQEAEAITAQMCIRLIYQDSNESRTDIECWLKQVEADFTIARLERSSVLSGLEIGFEQRLSEQELVMLPVSDSLALFVIEKPLPQLNKPGLFVMDMDSTAIEIECIDELAELAGVGREVKEVTERAMQGELDFEQSLRQRVAKLKGAEQSIVEHLCASLPITPGLPESIKELKHYGWRTVVASGGFTPFVNRLKDLLDLDEAHANELVFDNNVFTGEVTGDVVDAQSKANVLLNAAERWGIEFEQQVAIGDGANDIPMLEQAGFGFAFHAKPKLQAAADLHIAELDLACIPFLMRMG